MAVIDGIVLKRRHIVMLESLQRQALEQPYVNHMGIDETKLLPHKSFYWTSRNNDIENLIQITLYVLILANTAK